MSLAIRIEEKDIIHIKFHCPLCAQKMEATAEMLGKTVECPECKKALAVPALEKAPERFPVKRIIRQVK